MVFNNGNSPTSTREEGGVVLSASSGITSDRDLIRVKLEEGDTLRIFSRNNVSTGKSEFQYVTGLQVEAGGEAAAPFNAVVHPITAYAQVTPDKTVTVDGAGTYPISPTAETFFGANTFYVVPGSGVTASLSAALRLDPTLVYNELKAAALAAGS